MSVSCTVFGFEVWLRHGIRNSVFVVDVVQKVLQHFCGLHIETQSINSLLFWFQSESG